jgi:ferritin-like metal-binding protein YciE
MALTTMDSLFFEELRDLYSAENQLLGALPKMASAASSKTLKAAFEMHLEETRQHVERLNTIFSELGQTSTGETCVAMQGLKATR